MIIYVNHIILSIVMLHDMETITQCLIRWPLPSCCWTETDTAIFSCTQ